MDAEKVKGLADQLARNVVKMEEAAARIRYHHERLGIAKGQAAELREEHRAIRQQLGDLLDSEYGNGED